jgi:hypothetical protein
MAAAGPPMPPPMIVILISLLAKFQGGLDSLQLHVGSSGYCGM